MTIKRFYSSIASISFLLLYSSARHTAVTATPSLPIQTAKLVPSTRSFLTWRQRPATQRQSATSETSANPRTLNHRILPKWLRIPIPNSSLFKSLMNSPLVSICLSAVQGALFVLLAVEVFHAVGTLWKELSADWNSSPMGQLGQIHSTSPSSAAALLSPPVAKLLVTWLYTPLDQRGPAPRIIPYWMVLLAQDLKSSCHALSEDDFFRIFTKLTKEEAVLLQSALLRPSQYTTFSSIGGLYTVKKTLQDWVFTHCQPQQWKEERQQRGSPYSQLVQQGRQGFVLCGPPGCGKTLLMKATAQMAGWPTLVVTPSLLQRKWYGESTNQVRNLFGLVSTLGRCIVVLDEVDGLFRSRSNDESDVTRELKTEWLQWWDGIASKQQHSNEATTILVVAATNRPWDVDPAVWRRLPHRLCVDVPSFQEKCDLWRRWSIAYKLPPIDPAVILFMANHTMGYTASDLFHLLQEACQKGPLSRQDIKGRVHQHQNHQQQLTKEDVRLALQTVSPSRFSRDYIQQITSFMNMHQQHNSQPPHSSARSDYATTVNGAQGGEEEDDNGRIWQTPIGNFYQFNVPVDTEVFDVLNKIWQTQTKQQDSDDLTDDDIE